MKKILLSFLTLILFFGCTKDFEELNTNPTTTSEVPTSNLLTAAIQDLISLNAGLGYNKTCMLYVQYWSQREETGRSRYADINRDWASWYLGGLPELYNIIELNSGDNKAKFIGYGSNNNQIAVAKILRAWAYQNITDAWGDVPYSEVGVPEIAKPKYDSQESIYTSLLAELKEANSMIELDADGVKGDLIYDGDMAKWKKFANSLRARIAMRMSKANAGLAASELASAISDGVISSNEDNAMVAFQEEENFANPLFIEFKVQQWTYVSDVLVNAMSADPDNVDPRLPIYASPAVSTGTYVGLPYGLTDDASTEIPQDDASYPGELVRGTTFPSILFTYAEMLFIQAEAAKTGMISGGSTKNLYNDAIKASMDFWGVDAAAADAYINSPRVVYSDDNWKELLGVQKWIAFYMQGAQAWAEYRRIGYPILEIPRAEVQNGATQVPRRFYYDLAEENLNGDNLAAAISAMGGNDFNVRVWWDK